MSDDNLFGNHSLLSTINRHRVNAIAASTPLICYHLECPDAHISRRWNSFRPDPMRAVMFFCIRNKEPNAPPIYFRMHLGNLDVIGAVREHSKPTTLPGGLVEAQHPPPMMDGYPNQQERWKYAKDGRNSYVRHLTHDGHSRGRSSAGSSVRRGIPGKKHTGKERCRRDLQTLQEQSVTIARSVHNIGPYPLLGQTLRRSTNRLAAE